MALLSLQQLTLNLGGPLLFDGVSLHLEAGERACLVGRNGEGKSSLMRVINGELRPDSGHVIWQKSASSAYLPQTVPAALTGRVQEIVSAQNAERAHPIPDHEISTMLGQLGLDGQREFRTLSGGQQRRVLLARTLAAQPELLLLDEPTNHLDIAAIGWLEEWLLRHSRLQNTALLFVTHDRAFLQNLATRIVEIDRAHLHSHDCDYQTFLTRRDLRLESEAKTQSDFDKLLAQEEAWIRRGVKARTTRNQGRVRALMKLRQTQQARRQLQGKAAMQMQEFERSGQEVIVAQNVAFGYENVREDGEQSPLQVLAPALVRDFSIRILRGDKIGLVGPNGSGKSTLLQLLLGRIEAQSGRVKLGTRLQMAYFDQSKTTLDESRSVRWNVAEANDTVSINGQRRHVVTYLNEWLFEGERVHQPVKLLSGGERSRLLLAKLFTQAANLLVLDEPTNDLDIETLELLENLLVEFEGTVLLVSHDRAFLNNVVTSTLSPDGDGKWSEFVGGYDDLLRQRNSAPQVLAGVPEAAKFTDRPRSERARRISFGEKRELEFLPRRIETLESENATLVEQMSSAEFYKQNASQIAAAKTRLQQIETELSAAFARWEELETLAAQGL